MRARLLVALAPALFATAALAAVLPVDRDQLTISGRFELPHADASPFKGRLVVSDVIIDAAGSRQVGGKPDVFKTALTQAATKSLDNFGYLAAPGASDTVPIVLELTPFETTANKGEDTTVVARLKLRSADTAADACLPDVGEGKFKAISPAKSGNGRRAAGIMVVIAFAAAGYDASQFATGQFTQASQENQALNGKRRAEGEAVSPAHGEDAVASFASVNATRATLADVLRQLAEVKTCGAAQPAIAAASPAP